MQNPCLIIPENGKVKCSLYSTGESLSLLVERTAPAIGNVTVEWRIEGPRVSMTFTDTSGTLFLSEVMNKNVSLPDNLSISFKLLNLTSEFKGQWAINVLPQLLFQGMLNNTIVLRLLEDTTPEEREEYRVILSNIQTKGIYQKNTQECVPQKLNVLYIASSSHVTMFSKAAKIYYSHLWRLNIS